MPTSAIPIIFGAYTIASEQSLGEPDTIVKLFDLLESHKVTTIDTAEIYGNSEELLGQCGAGKRFVLDTKAPGGVHPGSGTEEEIVINGKASLKRLGVEQVGGSSSF